MSDQHLDLLVVGSGLCGLTIATTAAQRGLNVRCVGDGGPGASLANFGQWHSGAVYAPVLPDVAQACWLHRHRWRDLVDRVRIGAPHGYALFSDSDEVDRYREAWRRIGIVVEEMDHRGSSFGDMRPPTVAAFRIPDCSVDLSMLHGLLMKPMLNSGVVQQDRQTVVLHWDSDSSSVEVGPFRLSADVIVLATGARTPAILQRAGIDHTLRVRRIASGRYARSGPTGLTYWLDDDLLAISPDRDDLRVGLPGTKGEYGSTPLEYSRLRAALDKRRIRLSAQDLAIEWGTVCEPANDQADPSSAVLDLRNPPAGWSMVANLVVALPGKWTTAWHCADTVLDAFA